jgi:hypothetical protein
MSFVEDLAPFYADFGIAATVNGVAVSGLFDIDTPDAFGIMPDTRASLRVPATVAAAVGQSVVVNSTTYTIAAINNADFSGAEKVLALK